MLADYRVTPCVGVWIEISFLSRSICITVNVTPCVGVWIEIAPIAGISGSIMRHSLRGSVD